MDVKKIILTAICIPLSLCITTMALLIAYIYIDATDIFVSYDNYVFQKELRKALNSDKTEIHLTDLTNFKWDEMCLYPPYSYDGRLKEAIIDDASYNLQFSKDNNEIQVFPLRRGIFLLDEDAFIKSLGSFCFTPSGLIFIKDNHILTIKK